MSNHTTNDIVDPAFSERYRQLADESVNDEMTVAVLRTAREAVGVNRHRFWRSSWFRSVAFIALGGLSFSLLLQINDIPDGIDEVTSPASRSGGQFESAALATEDRIRAAEVAVETTRKPPLFETEPTSGNDLAPSSTNLPAISNCSTTERQDSGSWWRCIQTLETSGASEAAEQEMIALFEAFPGFVEPG